VPGTLTIGTDNGSAFTSRLVKATLTELGVMSRVKKVRQIRSSQGWAP